jgi:hypothetical protein
MTKSRTAILPLLWGTRKVDRVVLLPKQLGSLAGIVAMYVWLGARILCQHNPVISDQPAMMDETLTSEMRM